jgi:DNA replication protein DnaC
MKESKFSYLEFYVTDLEKPSTLSELRDNDGFGNFKIKIPKTGESVKFRGKLQFVSPSILISGKCKIETHKKYGVTVSVSRDEELKYSKRNAKQITLEDVSFFVQELQITSMAHIDKRNFLYGLKFPIWTEEFKKMPIYTELEFESRCEYFRIDYEMPLISAYGNTKRQMIRDLDPRHLTEAYDFLRGGNVWKLWFEKFTKGMNLKELPRSKWDEYRIKHKRQLPPMFGTALRIYSFLKEEREAGNEVFDLENLKHFYLHQSSPKWQEIANENNDEKFFNQALEFLMYHALTPALEDNKRYVCLLKDKMINMNLYHALSSFSGIFAPFKFKKTEEDLNAKVLTGQQEDFVRHVYSNQINLLEGAPGTGKTEVIVSVVNTCIAAGLNPLVVTYVGMMVDALQNRIHINAYTIHSTCMKKKEFLSQFQVLIIDEGSNIDVKLMMRLLIVTSPFISRIVMVGDLGQIYPIKPGCPFYDLTRKFPQDSFVLTENKRVDPDALELVEISKKIRFGEPIDLSAHYKGIKFVADFHHVNTRVILKEIVDLRCHDLLDTMKIQFIVLRNEDRVKLNEMIESILIEKKILKPSSSASRKIGNCDIYPGKKIQFLKNTKTPNYDTVRNGELGQVLKLEQKKDKLLLHLTNGKIVLIGGQDGVKPQHIQSGYATTCNKAQGSEWEYIVFWIYETPNPYFTREFPYVAVSRAKKHCTVIMSSEMDFKMLCAQKAKERKSLLKFYFEHLPPIKWKKLEEINREEKLIIPAFDYKYKSPEMPQDKGNKKIKVF